MMLLRTLSAKKVRKGGAHKDAAREDATTGDDEGVASESTSGNDEETTRGGDTTSGNAGEAGSNAAAITPPVKGGIPLFLSGSVLIVAGIFVARKAFWY